MSVTSTLIEYMVKSADGGVDLRGVMIVQGVYPLERLYYVQRRLEAYIIGEQLNLKGEVVVSVRLAGADVELPPYRRQNKNWDLEDLARMDKRLNKILGGVG